MEKNNEKTSKLVQTYAEDMAKVLETEKGGLIKKIIHSEEEHEAEKKFLSPQSKRNEFFMLLGLLLVLASIATLFFFFFKKDVPSVPVQKQFVPVIFTDKSILLEVAELKKDEIAKKVLSEVNATTVKPGEIEGIYLTLNKSPVGLRKFIELISASFVPGDKNFVDDNFLLGVVNSQVKPVVPDTTAVPPASLTPGTDQAQPVNRTSPLRDEPAVPTSKDFFILIKMRSVADIFNPMRTWEDKMFTDLHGFLGVDLSSDTKYLLTKNFEDGIVENKNARILYDTNGNIVLTYVFADDNSIIITNSPSATGEIILRLASSELKK